MLHRRCRDPRRIETRDAERDPAFHEASGMQSVAVVVETRGRRPGFEKLGEIGRYLATGGFEATVHGGTPDQRVIDGVMKRKNKDCGIHGRVTRDNGGSVRARWKFSSFKPKRFSRYPGDTAT